MREYYKGRVVRARLQTALAGAVRVAAHRCALAEVRRGSSTLAIQAPIEAQSAALGGSQPAHLLD